MDDWTQDEFLEAFENLYDPRSKIAMQQQLDTLFVMVSEPGRKIFPKILKERYGISMKALIAPNYHRLYHVIDAKLQQLLEAGLIDYSLRYWNDKWNPKRFVAEDGPQVLTLKDLEAGFVVSLVPLIISVVIFACEHLTKKISSSCSR